MSRRVVEELETLWGIIAVGARALLEQPEPKNHKSTEFNESEARAALTTKSTKSHKELPVVVVGRILLRGSWCWFVVINIWAAEVQRCIPEVC